MAAMDKLRDAANELAEAAKNLAEIAEGAAHAAPAAAAAASESGGIDPFLFQLSIFAMACFVGYYVVWSVTPALHTPLMSVTNAISSVIVVGGLVAAGVGAEEGGTFVTRLFGFIAVLLASVNIFGGFMVTERMLAMYKKKD